MPKTRDARNYLNNGGQRPSQENPYIGEKRPLHQSDFQPRIIEQWMCEAWMIFTGLEAALPDGTTHVKVFYAYDTNKLYIWDKGDEAWKSVTLS